VSFISDLGQARQKRIKLGTRIINAGFVEQAGVARRLPQTQQRLEDLQLGFAQSLLLDMPRRAWR